MSLPGRPALTWRPDDLRFSRHSSDEKRSCPGGRISFLRPAAAKDRKRYGAASGLFCNDGSCYAQSDGAVGTGFPFRFRLTSATAPAARAAAASAASSTQGTPARWVASRVKEAASGEKTQQLPSCCQSTVRVPDSVTICKDTFSQSSGGVKRISVGIASVPSRATDQRSALLPVSSCRAVRLASGPKSPSARNTDRASSRRAVLARVVT